MIFYDREKEKLRIDGYFPEKTLQRIEEGIKKLLDGKPPLRMFNLKLNDLAEFVMATDELPEFETYKNAWIEMNLGKPFDITVEKEKLKIKKVLATKAEALKGKIKEYLDEIRFIQKPYDEIVKKDLTNRPMRKLLQDAVNKEKCPADI